MPDLPRFVRETIRSYVRAGKAYGMSESSLIEKKPYVIEGLPLLFFMSSKNKKGEYMKWAFDFESVEAADEFIADQENATARLKPGKYSLYLIGRENGIRSFVNFEPLKSKRSYIKEKKELIESLVQKWLSGNE